jgi:hypothetical protein
MMGKTFEALLGRRGETGEIGTEGGEISAAPPGVQPSPRSWKSTAGGNINVNMDPERKIRTILFVSQQEKAIGPRPFSYCLACEGDRVLLVVNFRRLDPQEIFNLG